MAVRSRPQRFGAGRPGTCPTAPARVRDAEQYGRIDPRTCQRKTPSSGYIRTSRQPLGPTNPHGCGREDSVDRRVSLGVLLGVVIGIVDVLMMLPLSFPERVRHSVRRVLHEILHSASLQRPSVSRYHRSPPAGLLAFSRASRTRPLRRPMCRSWSPGYSLERSPEFGISTRFDTSQRRHWFGRPLRFTARLVDLITVEMNRSLLALFRRRNRRHSEPVLAPGRDNFMNNLGR